MQYAPLSVRRAVVAVILVLAPFDFAVAQSKITIGVPPVPEFVLPMIAVENGYFKDHGIDATIRIIPGGQSMPAALQSDSLQIAALSTASLIQVTDSGLDLVIVSGGAIASANDTNYGIVVGASSGIEKPEDFVGKKIGTPGLGSFFHIMAREWFRRKGVDWRKITFVESTFPQLADLLKAGTVDAVLTTNPFLQRAAVPGLGGKVFYIAADLPDRLPPFVYAASRAWAQAHRDAVAAPPFEPRERAKSRGLARSHWAVRDRAQVGRRRHGRRLRSAR